MRQARKRLDEPIATIWEQEIERDFSAGSLGVGLPIPSLYLPLKLWAANG
jgi:hypothetical protein